MDKNDIFEEVVNKYSKLIYKICLDMLKTQSDAEDAVQDVYINLYRNFDRYINLEGSQQRNIICKIALNRCKDILKSKLIKINRLVNTDIINLEQYEDDNDINEEIFKIERSKYISKMVNELKQPYSTLLYDYYINELTLSEISEKNNLTKGTIKVQIYRGKELLKEKMVNNGGDAFL